MSFQSIASHHHHRFQRARQHVPGHVMELPEERQLQATFASLDELCTALSFGAAEGAELELARMLTQWRTQLAARFEAEESSEYYGAIASNWPLLIWRLADLRADHAALLESASRVITLAGEQSCPRHELARRALEVLSRYRRHEESEAQLTQEFSEIEGEAA